jgi:hypothetical protein
MPEILGVRELVRESPSELKSPRYFLQTLLYNWFGECWQREICSQAVVNKRMVLGEAQGGRAGESGKEEVP